VPNEFKKPYSVHINPRPGFIDLNYERSSLEGVVVATARTMSSCSISAMVYDSEGRRGFARQTVTIEVPEVSEDEKLPMEEPPTWIEETADSVWDGIKDGAEAFNEGMKGFNDALGSMTPEQYAEWRKKMIELQQMNNGGNPSTPKKPPVYYPPPKYPSWTNQGGSSSGSGSGSNSGSSSSSGSSSGFTPKVKKEPIIDMYIYLGVVTGPKGKRYSYTVSGSNPRKTGTCYNGRYKSTISLLKHHHGTYNEYLKISRALDKKYRSKTNPFKNYGLVFKDSQRK
jgi:hypothetical protein